MIEKVVALTIVVTFWPFVAFWLYVFEREAQRRRNGR